MLTNIKALSRVADRYGVGLFAYSGVAFFSALTEWTTFVASLPLAGPIGAAFVGFVFGTLMNFALSRRFAFLSVRPIFHEFVLVVIASAVAFSANFSVYIILFGLVEINILVAKVIGTCAGFVFNYSVRQCFIFSLKSRFASISAILTKSRVGG